MRFLWYISDIFTFMVLAFALNPQPWPGHHPYPIIREVISLVIIYVVNTNKLQFFCFVWLVSCASYPSICLSVCMCACNYVCIVGAVQRGVRTYFFLLVFWSQSNFGLYSLSLCKVLGSLTLPDRWPIAITKLSRNRKLVTHLAYWVV